MVHLRIARWRSINPLSGMLLRAATCFPERPSAEWPRIDAMIVSILGRAVGELTPPCGSCAVLAAVRGAVAKTARA